MTDGTPPAGRPVIEPALVRRLVATQFPQWADLPVTSVELDGRDNRTFRQGDHLSVRLPSHERYAAQVAKKQRWLPLLAPQLPLSIPTPVAKGVASAEFAHVWSVYAWLDGEPVETAVLDDRQLDELASGLADFLNQLMRIDASGGPPPGTHNFYRGGPLNTYRPASGTRRVTRPSPGPCSPGARGGHHRPRAARLRAGPLSPQRLLA